MRLLAPAKITPFASRVLLTAQQGRATPQGFHPLLSWMCSVGLFDILDVKSIATPGVSLRCDDPALPCDHTNLIVRTVDAVTRAAGDRLLDAFGPPGKAARVKLQLGCLSNCKNASRPVAAWAAEVQDAARMVLGLDLIVELGVGRG